MSRRASLPGADELFRTTSPAPLREVPATAEQEFEPAVTPAASRSGVRTTTRRRITSGDRRPSGRERHEEKITIYLSPDELFDLEQARLALRGEHGIAVDRGRIVREALAVLVADLEAKGESSILVRRLRG
jgi:hypothetical protein